MATACKLASQIEERLLDLINAALLPVVRGYLERLATGVRALGITAPGPNSRDSGDCWPGLISTLTRR